MIKELTEHREKRFKIKGTAIVAYYKKSSNPLMSYIAYDYRHGDPITLNNIVTHGTWEEVVEPVDFLTAYKDCLENGAEYEVRGDHDPVISMKRNVYGVVEIFTLIKGFALEREWKKRG